MITLEPGRGKTNEVQSSCWNGFWNRHTGIRVGILPLNTFSRAGKDSSMLLRVIAFASLVCGFALARFTAAQDFRVETEVYLDQAREPAYESLTLFTGDVIYDYLLAPDEESTTFDIRETTMFDIRRGKLVLLDPRRQVKTSLTTEQLAEFSAAIKQRGTAQGPPDLFQPVFETSFDAEQNRLTLASDRLTYSAKAVPARHESGAHRYRQFADWYARLNAIRPGNVPPFGRLELNQALAERGLIPQEIERTVVVDRPVADKTRYAKSKHTVTWLISGTDQGRIDQTGHDLAKFQEVAPSEYWREPAKTARSK
jgi:hypothetical protein